MPYINPQDASAFSQNLQNNLGSAGLVQGLHNLLGLGNPQGVQPVPTPNPDMSLQAKIQALKQLQNQGQ